ncbi:MAG: hypothetical protein JKY61_12935 [Planctomycetes bacterium]|nr:hypothetical protein [Planctomycetota bacterium]
MGRKEISRLTLDKPVSFDDGPKIKELIFHEINAGDMGDMPLPMLPKSYLFLAAASTGHPKALIDKLSPFDAMMTIAEVETFFEPGQATGST